MLCFVFAALAVVLDQLFKHWITLTLPLNHEMILIPGVINLIHTENPGAAFSILPEQRWLLAAISFIATLVLIMILLRYNEGFWGTLGLAAVLGGTVGNMIDRIFQGYVVDMFRFRFIDFAIFNVADIFITLGALTFCIFFIVSSFKREPDAEKLAPASDGRAEERYEDDFDNDDGDNYPETREELDYNQLFYDDAAPGRDSEFDYSPQVADDFRVEPPDYYIPAREPPDQPTIVREAPGYDIPAQWEPPDTATSALDALGALESELDDMDFLKDYDVDKLLREYGFEDSN